MYQVTLSFLMQRLFRPWLDALSDTFIGVGLHPLLHPVTGAYIDRAYLIALRIVQNEESEWMRGMDTGDWDRSRGVLPTGQSGHPASRDYADMLNVWLNDEHHPLW